MMNNQTYNAPQIVSLISVLLFGYICLILALRCLGKEELRVRRRHIILESPINQAGEPFTPKMGITACAWGIVVLTATYGASVLCCAVLKDSITLEQICNLWAHADAVHYRKLAELGYHDYIENGQHLFLVFFPLYPWVVRLANSVVGNYDLCGHIVSSAAYIGVCYVLARLVTEDFSWQTARTSLFLLSVYPFSFFFAAYYTESLFLFLSVTTFYFIRKHQYWIAGIIGALASLTRMQGVLLLFVAFVEYYISDLPFQKMKAHNWRGLWIDVWKKLLPASLMLIGIGVYLWLNYDVEGDPLRFTVYQREHWSQYFVPLPNCLNTILKSIKTYGSAKFLCTIWAPEIVIFALSLGYMLYAARWMQLTWAAYFLACVVLNYSLNWPLSCGRYMACTFPLFTSIAVAGEKKPIVGQTAAVVFAIFQGAYLFSFLYSGSVF